MKIKKTNAMRILDQHKITYKIHAYDKKKLDDGIGLTKQIKEPINKIYKTIVFEGNDAYYVGIVPIEAEVDMKKIASAFNVKKLSLLHLKDLTKVTGYLRGGCSPIGMKKVFPTIVDETALSKESIIVSAGKIGLQVEINPKELGKVIDIQFADIQID